ncbi:MAG: FAD:protein FMN transferase [Ruminococcaceae bacterium]|nr:FAD:protein FMN transferase [Oscillospiraceae bacterium]
MKRIIAFAVALSLLFAFAGCSGTTEKPSCTVTFWDVFDTVTTITAVTDDREAFEKQAEAIHQALWKYHQLFDIYQEYDGITNLKSVNDAAGKAPVAVDAAIIRLLQDCKQYYQLTGGQVNVAAGSILKLWHDARETALHDPQQASLPEKSALQEAARYTDIEKLIIDEEKGTVFLSDEKMLLDVGAVAKGWAVQRVAENALGSFLINVGGNVCVTGPKDGEIPWTVGVNNPDGSSNYLHRLSISGGSVVTSGNYQRYYMVNEQSYHHIIQLETMMPGDLWQAVTVVCPDSALADALSTALFLLPLEEGKALLQRAGGEAFWLDNANNRFYSDGFPALIKA